MSDETNKPVISDRMQYLIGTLISLVIVVAYLFFSGEWGSTSPAETTSPVETEHQDIKQQ